MIKILVAIPCLTGAAHVKEAIESVINKENVDVIICANGAEQDVRDVINMYERFAHVILTSNPINIFVNPVWNQFIDHFLNNPTYSHLVIMNSDIIMQKDWDIVLKNRWSANPDEILIPIMSDDKTKMGGFINSAVAPAQRVHEGTPGVFITMNQVQAKMIFPIPEEILVWFGDNFILGILREFYATLIPENLLSFHYWSQTVQKVAGIHAIIELDKIAWEQSVQYEVKKRIEKVNKQLKSKKQ